MARTGESVFIRVHPCPFSAPLTGKAAAMWSGYSVFVTGGRFSSTTSFPAFHREAGFLDTVMGLDTDEHG